MYLLSKNWTTGVEILSIEVKNKKVPMWILYNKSFMNYTKKVTDYMNKILKYNYTKIYKTIFVGI